jgi:hypothetical protein
MKPYINTKVVKNNMSCKDVHTIRDIIQVGNYSKNIEKRK